MIRKSKKIKMKIASLIKYLEVLIMRFIFLLVLRLSTDSLHGLDMWLF